MLRSSIQIEKLRVYAYHGVGPQEACVGNDFEIDALLHMPCPTAVVTDSLAHTLNYADVIDIIKSQMAECSHLLEHVAGRIHNALTAKYPAITGGRITIWKLQPPITAQVERVGFTLEW